MSFNESEMSRVDYSMEDLFDFLEQVRDLSDGEAISLHTNSAYASKVGLRAQRDDGKTEVRMRFSVLKYPFFESPCILKDMETGMFDASAEINATAESWTVVAQGIRRGEGYDSARTFLENRGKDARQASPDDREHKRLFTPERDLDRKTWEMWGSDTKFKHVAENVTLDFNDGKCVMTRVHKNPDLDIDETSVLELGALDHGDGSHRIQKQVEIWKRDCAAEERVWNYGEFEDAGIDRADHIKEIKKLRRALPKADVAGKNKINNQILDLTFSVRFIDRDARAHLGADGYADFVKTTGGVLRDHGWIGEQPGKGAGKNKNSNKGQSGEMAVA